MPPGAWETDANKWKDPDGLTASGRGEKGDVQTSDVRELAIFWAGVLQHTHQTASPRASEIYTPREANLEAACQSKNIASQ